ncbi:methyltransferase family protein [Salegentibacter sp. 24]|uniref:class I SAM-dependent DNA methyltransferase n=1 Tax=Salegentibacter sp. 24 TaxID=2183986 RepID=UPI00105ED8DE|nr:class I SAM-dependent methyltransferase [Salegentibacter sp. 24]TDN79661.1 methyltransferase family protein [Salegentibacter sp. 24]
MKISQAYNLWAGTYNEVPNKTRDLEAKAIRASLGNKNFEQSLELGCGTGKNTFWLAERSKSMTALDFSEKMLEKARKLDPKNKVNFIKTDLQKAWPVAAVNFDLISCSLVLEHIEDLDFIFQQASRILVKKGEFYLCELHPFKQYLGSKARFETSQGTQELEVYRHHISDYIKAAEKSGLELKGINEYFDQDKNEIPRLISFLFKK